MSINSPVSVLQHSNRDGKRSLKSQLGPDGKNAISWVYWQAQHMVLKLLKQDVTNQQDNIMPGIVLVTKKENNDWLLE